MKLSKQVIGISVIILIGCIVCLYSIFYEPEQNIKPEVKPSLVESPSTAWNPTTQGDTNLEKIQVLPSSEEENECDSFYEMKYSNVWKTVSGRVMDVSGQSIEGAKIYALQSKLDYIPPPPAKEFMEKAILATKTSHIGDFELNVKLKERYYLLIESEQYIPVTMVARPGDRLLVVLEKFECNCEGQIYDAVTKLPVEGAIVEIEYKTFGQKGELLSKVDEEGKFYFSRVPTYVDKMEIKGSKYQSIIIRNWPSKKLTGREWQLMPIEEKEVILICVSKEDGTPLKQITYNNNTIFSDLMGKYRINVGDYCRRNIPKVTVEEKIMIDAAGFCSAIVDVSDINGSKINRIEMTPSVDCRGRIVDKEGNGLEGVRIDIAFDERATPMERIGRVVFEPTWTDEEGMFVGYKVPLGEHLLLRMSRKGDNEQVVRNVIINDRHAPYVGDIVYKDLGVLLGEVVDEEGCWLPSVWVMAIRKNGTILRDMTDENGQFRIETNEVTKLHLSKSGYFNITDESDIVIPEEGVINKKFVMKSAAEISGEVVDSNGNCTPGSVVIVCNDDDLKSPVKTSRADEKGKFIIRGFEQGKKYFLKAFRRSVPKSYSIGEGDCFIGGTTGNTLTVSDMGYIIGEIRKLDGELVNNEEVVVLYRNRDKTVKWKGRGFYSGYYSLVVEPGNWEIKAEAARLVSNEIIKLQLIPEQWIEGHIVMRRNE